MTRQQIRTRTDAVTRIDVASGAAYDDFRARYESAVPELDAAVLDDLMRSGASWDDEKLAALLGRLGVDVPPALLAQRE